MTRTILASGVATAALALGLNSAMATTINGGGATLPQPTYQDLFDQYTSSFPTILFSYDGVGSGSGQTAFLTNDITLFNSPTNQYGTIVGTTVHFGASDATLSTDQINGYTRKGTDGAIIQIPTIGVGIAIPYVNAGLSTTLKLTDNMICGVLSGKLTNWSQLSKAATPGTIQVVYRSDSSGTSFLLTNHLNAVCNSGNSTFASFPVAITKTFASLFPSGVPSNFTGESGSSAVAAQMVATPLSFGYLSPDYTSIAPNSSNTTSLKVASVVNANTGIATAPRVANIQLALNNPGPTATNPTPPATAATAADQTKWVPLIPTATKGYPIVGYTTWDLSTCYSNASIVTALEQFLNKLYTNNVYKNKIALNGFASLSNTSASRYVAAVQNTFLSNASGFNLNINNATACAGKPGR